MMQSSFLSAVSVCSSFAICFRLPIGHFIHLANETRRERERERESKNEEKTSLFLSYIRIPAFSALSIHPSVILMMNISSNNIARQVKLSEYVNRSKVRFVHLVQTQSSCVFS